MEGAEAKERNSGPSPSPGCAEKPAIMPRRKSRRLSLSSQEGSSVLYTSSEGTTFRLDHEATRQEEIAEFLRRNVSSTSDLKSFADSTLRLLKEICRTADARGERVNVQIPSPEVLNTIRNVVDDLIEDVKEVRMKVLSRKKVTSRDPSVMSRKVHGCENGNSVVHTMNVNLKDDELKPQWQDSEAEAEADADAEVEVKIEQGMGAIGPDDVIRTDVVINDLSCLASQLGKKKALLRRKRTRVMCQACLIKPRRSVILGCKHSMYCSPCLNDPDMKVNNCPGCGEKITDIVYCNVR
ncbi:hypothetical protein MPTK1_7g17330 [Marchantia polymorpha subsp. ruderalis]|uniref:RING-type domain-containing protein n=2 Tax=Marchantia polymorpha TaxID=3197 RepID=A0AAF6C0R0_MARPO|nr:hypothetical protein MARPO_0051s0070 [Marchantia polymorpha]BBN17844.1 hypothetical protein Mp_7g17330 [Marchantia polymorpha subsp. ruderalis]|eukprot:PTQ38469.1 hypothetical protein MARPO_0051s0070 [Marchantia polymorpha]